jgi:hypothetical protein
MPSGAASAPTSAKPVGRRLRKRGARFLESAPFSARIGQMSATACILLARARWSPAGRRLLVRAGTHLGLDVVLQSNFVYKLKLRLQPLDVLLGILQDVLK